MSVVESRIAAALAEHQLSETFRARNRETGERALVARCTCGSVVPDFPAHQASVVAALPDTAIVELPAMDAPNSWSALPGFRNPVELTLLDRYPIRHSGDVITNAEGARYLAARLLAAVRAAGGQA